MPVRFVRQQDVAIVEITGDVDGKSAPELQTEISAALQGVERVLLDFTGVSYMSSAGLRMLLSLYRQLLARKGRIVLVGLSDEIRDVMTHTGFIGFFVVANDRSAALTSLEVPA
ncbi:MAG TPA: STAS domain-containing protein [Acetobacteraceae bacterium]|nr:STAS domain-containing protein [Acetobacteraceae bacterium]